MLTTSLGSLLASPAPAVQELLAGVPVYGIASSGETGTPTALAGTTYGGGTVEGDFSAVIPQFGQFAFGLDNMIYKNVAAKLTITQFVVAVPEASTWWGSSIFVLAFGWRYWWGRRKGRAKVNPPVALT